MWDEANVGCLNPGEHLLVFEPACEGDSIVQIQFVNFSLEGLQRSTCSDDLQLYQHTVVDEGLNCPHCSRQATIFVNASSCETIFLDRTVSLGPVSFGVISFGL